MLNKDSLCSIDIQQIDISDWSSFKLSSLFKIEIAKSTDKVRLIESKSGVNYISRRTDNNGLECKAIVNEDISKNAGQVLTITMVGAYKGTTFWQDTDFIASQNLLLLRSKYLNELNAMFLATLLTKKYRTSNDYNAIKKTNVLTDTIRLPSKKDKHGNVEPDWIYMQNYVLSMRSELKQKDIETLILKIAATKEEALNIENWTEFEMNAIFTLKPSKNREASKYEAGDIRFVASGSTNNGIQKYVSPNNETLDAGNCLSFSTIDCSCFYQDQAFLGRGHGALIEIRNSAMNKFNALFVATILKKLSHKYNYNNQCWLYILAKEKIRLPSKKIDSVIKPDWEEMERYIKTLSIGIL